MKNGPMLFVRVRDVKTRLYRLDIGKALKVCG